MKLERMEMIETRMLSIFESSSITLAHELIRMNTFGMDVKLE